MRVINDKGEMVGVMPPGEALLLAREQGLDLIEVSPTAKPPVVKILSYDKYRYQQEKAEAEARKRQKRIEVKGIRLSVRIGAHDLEFKAAQAIKFMEKGNKVKIEMFLRGRERANLEFAFSVLKKFLASIQYEFNVEQQPKRLANIISAVIGPKNA